MSDKVKRLRILAEEGYRFAGEAAEELKSFSDHLEAAEKERDAAELMSLALRAKIEQMEKQEPAAWAAEETSNG